MAITKGSLLNKMFGWTDPRNMYGNADDEADGLRNQLMNQAQAQAYQNVVLGGSGSGLTFTGTLNMPKPNPDHERLPDLRMEDLEGPAGRASLEELKDLWRARWSDRWVKRGEINDEFYTICAQRLLSSDRLEAHELADGTHVYRLIEK
jgi:hypothetical protein